MAEETLQHDDSEDEQFQADKKPKGRLESAYYSVVSRTTTDGRVMIGPDIEVFPDKECSAFASPGSRAYDAKDRRWPGELFVLTCGRSTVPRVTMIGSYKAIKNPNIIRLIDAGVANWAPENRQRFALVFEKPAGKKIMDSEGGTLQQISEDRLITSVIDPIVRVLADFRNVDLVHGAINAENIFLVGPPGSERAILGECLSSAPSWGQHPIYETSVRAGAQPSGRGIGTIKDDLYALGVCVAMMVRGENLLLNKSPRQIIYEKMELGSYSTIIGRERMPAGIAEFLRGVLNDDEMQRWSIDSAMHWLEGRRLSPKQSRVILKAARPLVFNDQKYWDLRSLAQAFSESIMEAAAELEKGQFEVWLKRNFEDKALEARYDRVWSKEKDAPRERLVSSICMALDPLGAVRYKGLSIFPAGLGTALAQAMAKEEDIQLYGELVAHQLLNAWISQSFEDITDAAGFLSLLERCRSALTQKMPGYGIERVLYLLNMDVACMSPLLRRFFVLTPGSLLLALEDLAKQANRPEVLLDRHMIAFISVREPKMIDPFMGYINAQGRGHQLVGIMRALAAIQRRFATGPVPGVCSWLISLSPAVIDLLNDRDLRNEVTRRVGLLKDGSLTSLLELIDNPAMMREDMQRFAAARQEYRLLVVEKSQIDSSLKRRRHFGKATGRQVAMIASTVLATIIVVGYVILRLTQGL